MKWLIALIIIVPIVEIWSIIEIGQIIGAFPTLAFMIATAAAGAYLAKREGRRAWTEAQRQMQNGQMPGRTILDGLCIVAGGLLLLTPGFFTDIVGLTLLLPPTRIFYRSLLLKWLEKRMRGGPFTIRRY